LFEQDDLPYNEPIVNEGMICLMKIQMNIRQMKICQTEIRQIKIRQTTTSDLTKIRQMKIRLGFKNFKDQMKEDLTQLMQTSNGSQFPADASESDADKEEEELEGFKNINLRKGKKQVRIQLPPSRKKRPLPGS
jgi:hypothetical protein